MAEPSFEAPHDPAVGSSAAGKPGRPQEGKAPRVRIRRWFDWWFRNRRSGRITIVQVPNVALWIFFATVALRRVVPTGTAARTTIEWAGVAALSWWAVDEVVRGVNPWRRLLGAGGSAFAIAGLASMLR